MTSSPPASYASADEARAYVARVLSRPAPSSPAAVYVITAPGMPSAPGWGKILTAVGRLLPGAALLTFGDVFKGAPRVEKRIETIAARAGGALVIPRAWRTGEASRYLLGYAARAEAAGLVAAGRPVLVLTPRGVVAWPDVSIRPADPPVSRWLPLELGLPSPPAGVLLPTVAASYHALGLPRPRPRQGRPGARRPNREKRPA